MSSLMRICFQINIVLVITQYIRDAGFHGLRPLFFMPSEKI